MKRHILGLLLVLAIFNISFAQTEHVLSAENSTVVVEGGSTLKDWKATVNVMTGTCSIVEDSSFAIASASMQFETGSMDGGRGPDMNAKIYKALDSKNHSHINFESKAVDVNPGAEGKIIVKTTGTLTIAGKAQDVTLQLEGTQSPLALTGQHTLTFSSFDITPPSALFGQIVCDDEMTIVFNLVFE
ncbi:MAG: YceI family protein [Saprospiraceae bacterium]|nr:YceI family protein [Saprospiraceae bacterium]